MTLKVERSNGAADSACSLHCTPVERLVQELKVVSCMGRATLLARRWSKAHRSGRPHLRDQAVVQEDHHENHEDSHSGKGGYVFSSPEEVAAVKAQRALLWDFLKVGSCGVTTVGPRLIQLPRFWL